MTEHTESAEKQRVVVVATRFGKLTEPNWNVWPDTTFDEAVAKVTERVRENHRSMEVREVEVLRHVAVNPVVETVSITEPGKVESA